MSSDSPSLRAIISELESLTTESMLVDRADLDTLATRDLVDAMNLEDARVPAAVAAAGDDIARAVDGIADRLRRGGRLIYLGAGTAGRVGVLDASECPPTFGTSPDLVVGMVAGGPGAIQTAVEGAEDDPDGSAADFDRLAVGPMDVVVGISASGRTPYVTGALDRARARGALAISVAANADSVISRHADVAIETVVGPEFVSGSTRLKAGTAQKLVLNMLSTLSMIKLGKTYHGVMVDLQATNEKLHARSVRTVATITGCDYATAADALTAVGGGVKPAILTILTGMPPADTTAALDDAQGILRVAIGKAQAR
ncbi:MULTISPECIES: N-acetylmuramic acid 6-phosphate etherase [unclassified Microbacterium]|uniref:N-acetylmuramic acid 6-phosphate etherase n=1 Tax=unclassified Microbacterium TaxID=2609290 RepID=UPI00257DC2E4|nr:N-acetylmuramic acid 6-phosphate etherase [Microbacterium sp.]